MIFNKTSAVAGGAAVLIAFASAASAQQAPAPRPAAPAAPPVTHGPALAGVCIFSSARAVATSDLGKYVDGRLQQIVTQVNSELNAEKAAIETEARAIDAARATLTPEAVASRGEALQVRANAFQRKAQLREREVQATEQKAYVRVAQELDPVVRTVYQQRQCSLLLDRQSVLLANPAMEITDLAVAGLNAKIKSFTFDRERLDAAPQLPTAPVRR